MPLNDPSSLTALKAQLQIGGTPQVNTFQTTFHYQMAYRVQNHSLDILVPGQDNAGDALMMMKIFLRSGSPRNKNSKEGPTGHAKIISPVKATLNWQSEKVVAQNKVLVKILSQQ
ncbi:hypothetical protein Tco_0230879, partial [Tanacetum coccineum]